MTMQFHTPEKRTRAEESEPLTPSGMGSSDTPSQKKKRARTSGEAKHFTPTSATKRGQYDTPTRTTLQKMVPIVSSPAVVVSIGVKLE